VLEALEAGDQAEAVELLLDALEEGGEHRIRCYCRDCGRGFEWPGLRDAHVCSGVRRVA
jgi:hypothetical protein